MKLFSIIGLIFIFEIILSEKNYTNYKLIHVYPLTVENARYLSELELKNADFDIWSSSKSLKKPFEVLLSADAYLKYSELFNQLKISFEIVQDNMQEIIDEEKRMLTRSKMEGRVVGTYARFNSIIQWMDSLVAMNPAFIYNYISGKTIQNRDLKVLVLKVGNPSKSIWIDCGIHAREWISPATCVNLIDKFVSDYQKNVTEIVNILNKYEIHIIPVLNPDGYEYSHTFDRYWRKNRRPNPGSTCPGVDLNRNFPFQWLTGGSATEPCIDTYAGSSAGSELETQAVVNAMNSKNNWAAYLSIHSYGNWFLTPYGYTYNLPPDFNLHQTTGNLFANSVKSVYGELFDVGNTADLLYIASGNSADWAYASKKITHSYTIELRPRNGASIYGFVLSENQIPQVGEEIYVGIRAIINSI